MRYSHTVVALLIMGSFIALAVGAWYLKKGRHTDFAMKTVRVATVCAIVTTGVMLVTAHSSAVTVAEEQPTKLAMMEGAYETESMPLYAFGWVDEETQQVITPFSIPGGTSFLATGDFSVEYQGLNDLAESGKYGDAFTAETVENLPVNAVFPELPPHGGHVRPHRADHHSGARLHVPRRPHQEHEVAAVAVHHLAAVPVLRHPGRAGSRPRSAVSRGSFTPAESSPAGVSLEVGDAYSQAVSGPEVALTIVLFVVVYLFLIIGWARIVAHQIKKGPEMSESEAQLMGFDASATKAVAAAGVASGAATGAPAAGKDGE